MTITGVRIYLHKHKDLLAFASIELDGMFAVHSIKIVETPKGLLIAMPSRKSKDGVWHDVAHPTSEDFRAKLEKAVREAFSEATKTPEAA